MVQSTGARRDAAVGPARARRREILAAASRVFREKGFHGSGMRDIAGALGIAVGKLYYYFGSKEDLLAFCQEDTLRRLLATVEHVRGLGLDPAEALFLTARGHVRCLNAGNPGSLAHLEVESLAPERRGPVLRLRQRYERRLQALVREGVECGAFAPIDPKLAVLSLLGALNWTVKWYRPEGRMPLEEIEVTFARLHLAALLAPGRRLEEPDGRLLDALETDDE